MMLRRTMLTACLAAATVSLAAAQTVAPNPPGLQDPIVGNRRGILTSASGTESPIVITVVRTGDGDAGSTNGPNGSSESALRRVTVTGRRLTVEAADDSKLGAVSLAADLTAEGNLRKGAFAAVTAAALVPTRAIAQETVDPMAATVAQWFTMIEQSFVGLADAMPADKYAFKPGNGAFKDVRTFGEQVKHVACANFAFFNEVEKKTPPDGCETGGPGPAKTKAELMTYLRDSFTYAGRVMRTMTPANALDPAGGPYGGQSTRLGLATLAIWHASDHYGQLVVYLRMNGIIPPASRPAPPR